jgi:hypothetical protein
MRRATPPGGFVLDVRDLEVPSVDGVWDWTPDALRAACTLLVPLAGLAVLRVWMVATQWHEFVRVFGRSSGLDMDGTSGWALAELRTPGQWTVAVDALAVLALLLLVPATVHRWPEARVAAVALAGITGVDALASVAYPVPWWYVVAGAMLAGSAVLLVVLLLRPTTSMHLRAP